MWILRPLCLVIPLALWCWTASGLSAGTDSANQLYEEALGRYRAGNYFEALVTARKAVALAPEGSQYHHLLGMVYFALQLDSDARPALKKAIELDPDQPTYYYDLALVYMRDNELEQAEEYLKKTLEFKPDFALGLLLLGRVYHNQSKTESALELFEKARILDLSLRALHFHIGYAYKAMGQNDKAIEEMEKEAELHPDYLPARVELGEIHPKHRNP